MRITPRIFLIGALMVAGILGGIMVGDDSAVGNAPRGLTCASAGLSGALYEPNWNVPGQRDPIAAVHLYAPRDADLSTVFEHSRDKNLRLIEWYGSGGQTLAVFTLARKPLGGWTVMALDSCPGIELPSRDLTPEEQADYQEAQERMRRALEKEDSN